MEPEYWARCVACVFGLLCCFSSVFFYSLFCVLFLFLTVTHNYRYTKFSPAFTSRIRGPRARTQFGKARTFSPIGQR